MSKLTVFQEVEFSMDDLSKDVYFELPDDVDEWSIFNEEILDEIFEVIQKSDWFVQGNKTEGIITIGERIDNGVQFGWNINLDWKSITMGSDWDTDTEEEYERNFFLTLEFHRWVLTPQ
jgi:hypothetical protein